jgi:nicotinate-nucleotide adenylyltransferase
MARLGIFGGSFDPPHLGHLILAETARVELRLDSVLWIPSPNPPHKTRADLSEYALRRRMVAAAIGGNPSFELSDIECERPGPYYTIDTVRILQQSRPTEEWRLLIGEDSLRDLPLWHDPTAVIAAVPLVTMRRPHSAADLSILEGKLPGITARTSFLDAPTVDISSTQIRARVRENSAYRYLVPESVAAIIQTEGLYR